MGKVYSNIHTDDIEMEVYRVLCSQCPNARRCHDDCDTCSAYDREIAKANKKGR
jgi:hypothetical protein